MLAVVADPGNDPRWRERVSAVELLAGTAGEPGARYLERMRIRGSQVESEVELLEVVPGERARFRILRPIAGEGEYRVAAAGAGTELKLVIDLPVRSGLAGIADRMIAEAIGRGAREDLARLRAVLEEPGGEGVPGAG